MTAQILTGHTRDLGGFTVTRILPQVACRAVGPFVFYDQMGPARFQPGQGIDVRPHPHIGLSTLTWLFEGRIMHRDSLGYHQAIEAGAVNSMTAGRGISHSERTHPDDLANGQALHGIQVWIALPDDAEEIEPAFAHHPADTIPRLDRPGAILRLIAGEAYGAASPVAVHSRLFYLQADLEPGAILSLPDGFGERAVHVVEGAASIAGQPMAVGQLAILTGEDVATVSAGPEGARLMLLGGDPVGPRFLDWNFVASSKEKLAQAHAAWAAEDWSGGRFSLPPGDDREWIPLPG
jgi:redox-sensitive bicupin YhaK (pirin superfamily)